MITVDYRIYSYNIVLDLTFHFQNELRTIGVFSSEKMLCEVM